MSFRPCVFIGLISYSLYLWHQPVFTFFRHAFLREPGLLELLALLTVIAVLSVLSWRFVELPCRNRAVVRPVVFKRSAASLVVVLLAVSGAVAVSRGVPQRFPAYVVDIFDAKSQMAWEKLSDDKGKCHNRDVADACVLGSPGKAPTVALVGDSHAAAVSLAFDEYLREKGLGGKTFSMDGCPYLVGYYEARGRCNEHNEALRSELESGGYTDVIYLARFPLYWHRTFFDNREGGREISNAGVPLRVLNGEITRQQQRERFGKSLHDAVNSLLRSGINVHLVYPIPEAGWDVPKLLGKRAVLSNLEPITTSFEVYQARNEHVFELLDHLGSENNLKRIYPDGLFCNRSKEARCDLTEKEISFYADDDHLSISGAKLLFGLIGQKVTSANPNFSEEIPEKSL